MAKIILDKYYTNDTIALHCIEMTNQICPIEWERIIEPSVGAGAFLQYLPKDTIYIDIEPDEKLPDTVKADFRLVDYPYIPNSIVIGN